MIRLYESLPETITVDGKDYLIKTDFRYWLIFSEMLQKDVALGDLLFLFEGDIPTSNFIEPLLEFYINKNSTPHSNSSDSGDKLLDYNEDGEYIYASFLAEYGIDLIDIEYLHWWKFKALFLGLPDDSCIKKIMEKRAYKKSNKSYEQSMREQKQIWSLPLDDENDEILRELDELLYNS